MNDNGGRMGRGLESQVLESSGPKKNTQYLDGGFRQVQFLGQFAAPGPTHVIFLVELFLEAADLFSRKRGSVPTDFCCRLSSC